MTGFCNFEQILYCPEMEWTTVWISGTGILFQPPDRVSSIPPHNAFTATPSHAGAVWEHGRMVEGRGHKTGWPPDRCWGNLSPLIFNSSVFISVDSPSFSFYSWIFLPYQLFFPVSDCFTVCLRMSTSSHSVQRFTVMALRCHTCSVPSVRESILSRRNLFHFHFIFK